MSTESRTNPTLSEISHLFLSDVRERHQAGARPVRRPPQAKIDVSVDLTPEEYARVFSGASESAAKSGHAPVVNALIATQLGAEMPARVREYARHLASSGQRIGMIEVDASEFRLSCFDCAPQGSTGESEPVLSDLLDARKMTEAIQELQYDVDRWLVVMSSTRTPESRNVLRQAKKWVLLSKCDHEGVVASYRLLKGLAETAKPRLSLALLEATDSAAEQVFEKLSSVSKQFLAWNVTPEEPVKPAPQVTEHTVMVCRSTKDKAAMANAPHWQLVGDFLASGADEAVASDAGHDEAEAELAAAAESVMEDEISEPAHAVVEPTPVMSIKPEAAMQAAPATETGSVVAEVFDVPAGELNGAAILSAVLGNSTTEMVECPIRPPMCPESRLAVSRDRHLILMAVARQGLQELRSIGQAYRWLIENRPLIAMAVPQFSIDVHQMPKLRLIVNQADLSAEILQPMLQSGHVTVHAYRKLKWGAKMGLLLEAA